MTDVCKTFVRVAMYCPRVQLSANEISSYPAIDTPLLWQLQCARSLIFIDRLLRYERRGGVGSNDVEGVEVGV